MALPENRMSHPNYCYLCDEIHTGKCGEIETTQVGKSVDIKPLLAGSGNDSVLAREIWNAAIEAAALSCKPKD